LTATTIFITTTAIIATATTRRFKAIAHFLDGEYFKRSLFFFKLMSCFVY